MGISKNLETILALLKPGTLAGRLAQAAADGATPETRGAGMRDILQARLDEILAEGDPPTGKRAG